MKGASRLSLSSISSEKLWGQSGRLTNVQDEVCYPMRQPWDLI